MLDPVQPLEYETGLFLAITCNSLKARENQAYMVRLVLVLLHSGSKTGASLLSQSLSIEIAIA